MRSLFVSLALACAALSPLPSEAQGIGVDAYTGLPRYRYDFELPAARGRYQPSLALLHAVPGNDFAPAVACMSSNIGFGVGWNLDLPSVSHDGAAHLAPSPQEAAPHFALNLPRRAKVLRHSTRDGGGFVADVESSYMKFSWSSSTRDTMTAVDAAGNVLTFWTYAYLNTSLPFRLVKVEDPDGNVTRFTYNGGGSGLLARIDYNAFRDGPGDRTATGPVGESGSWGASVVLTWGTANGAGVLDSVTILVKADQGALQQAVQVRKYQMAYGSVGSANQTPLTSITQTGALGGTEALITRFGQASNSCLGWVTTPLGARQDVTYLTSASFGDAVGSAYTVVKSITTSGVAMPSNTVSYWYASPQRPQAGDYRGFSQSWSQDSTTGLVQRTTWDTASRPFMGWPLKVEIGTQLAAGTTTMPPTISVFRTVTSTHSARGIDSGACTGSPTDPGSSAYPLIPVATSELDEVVVDGVTLGRMGTASCNQVDRWGNATQTIEDPDTSVAGNDLTVTSTFLATTDPAKLCKDCVKSRETYAGSSLLEKMELGYDVTGKLLKVQRQSVVGQTSASFPEVATYSYFGNGNLSSRTEGGATYVYTHDDWFQARVAKVEASDVLLPGKLLATETAFDGAGRPVKVVGPYYQASGSPESLKPERHLSYDSLGRLVAVARQAPSGATISGGLAAFTYQPFNPLAPTTPASVTAFQLAVAKSFQIGAPPQTEDARQVTTFLDGLGRAIQSRERLGGPAGDPLASIVQPLLKNGTSQYRVNGAVVLDGAGRVRASLAPYYSASGSYRDPLAVNFAAGVDEAVKGPVHATWTSYDSRGREVCSTLRVVTGQLGASEPAAGSCVSSFNEGDGTYARATKTAYRGYWIDGRAVVGVKSIEPRFTIPTGAAFGPESFTDAAGLLRRTVDAEGNRVSYEFDSLGRPTATVREAPGSGRARITSSVTLDMLGRVSARTDPNFGKRSFSYDSTTPGLLRAVTFTKTGQQVRYGYDLGRIAKVEFCDAGGACTTDADLSWDLPYPIGGTYLNTAGKIGYASNPRTTVALSYDDNGAMVRRDQWIAGEPKGFSITTARREDGRGTQESFIPDAGFGLQSLEMRTGYDSAGRAAQVAAGTSTLWQATIGADGTGAYDAFGRLAAATVDDGGVAQVWTRGVSSGLLQAQSVSIVGAANPVVYNVSGMSWRGTQLVGYTDTVAQRTHRFWYSQTGRLVSAQAKDSVTAGQVGLTCVGFGTSKQFVPGPSFGNIEVVREGSGTPVTSAYGYTEIDVDPGLAGPDAPTAVGTTSLTYDEFGRVVTKGSGESFGYDLAGRLVTVSRSAGPSETIEYDPFGLPVRRTVSGQVTWYLGRQATMTGVGGALKADVHVEVNGQRVASVRVGATPRTLFLHRDRLTSVVATSLAGRVAGASYRYMPHGAVEATSGDTGDAASELGYAGALRLSGGLLWMGARVYDPALKIFLQPDPLAPHTYAYADGDPINKWDPTGLQAAYCGEMIRCPSDDDRIKVGPRWEYREQEPPPPTVVTNGELLDGTEAPGPGVTVNTGPFPSSPGAHLAPGDLSGRPGGGPRVDGGGAPASKPQFNEWDRWSSNFWWSYGQTRSAERWLLGASWPEAAYDLFWENQGLEALRKFGFGLAFSKTVKGPAADLIGGRASLSRAFDSALVPRVGMDWGRAGRTLGAGLVRGIGIGLLVDLTLMATAAGGALINATIWTWQEEQLFLVRHWTP